MTSISSIKTNAPVMQYQSQLSRSIDKQNTSMERLSSGLKINTAKDDAGWPSDLQWITSTKPSHSRTSRLDSSYLNSSTQQLHLSHGHITK